MSQMLHLRWNSFQNQIVKNDFCIIKMMTMSFYFIELFWFILIKFVVRNGFKQVSLFEECVISIIQVFYGVLHVIILVNLLFPNDKHNWSAKLESFFLTPVPKKICIFCHEMCFWKKKTPVFNTFIQAIVALIIQIIIINNLKFQLSIFSGKEERYRQFIYNCTGKMIELIIILMIRVLFLYDFRLSSGQQYKRMDVFLLTYENWNSKKWMKR